MILQIIALSASFIGACFSIITYRVIKKQNRHIQFLINDALYKVELLKFISESEVNNLLRSRHDFYNWQRQFEDNEEYETAQQAKELVQRIDELIDTYEDINNYNEEDD